MGASLYELPPGQSICPYHYEYPEEEWLVVLAGRVLLRHPGGEQELAEGDVVCFPQGPDGAHKVTCLGKDVARVLMSSTRQTPAIAVYPDSDKVAIFPGDDRDRLTMRRDTLDYWDGEVEARGLDRTSAYAASRSSAPPGESSARKASDSSSWRDGPSVTRRSSAKIVLASGVHAASPARHSAESHVRSSS